MEKLPRLVSYSVLIVVGVIYAAASLYLFIDGLIFTTNNLFISTLTAGLFVLGFGLHLYTVTRIRREVVVIQNAARQFSFDPSVGVLNELYGRLPTRDSRSLINDLRVIIRDNKAVSPEILRQLLSTYSLGTPGYLQFLAATALLLGLLGTFMGIIQAINAYASIIPSAEGAVTFLGGIMAGLDKAFGTTMAGMISSVCLSGLVLSSRALGRERFNAMRSFLISGVHSRFGDGNSMLLERIINASINRVLPSLVRDTSEQLRLSVELLKAGADSFAESGKEYIRAADSVTLSTRAHMHMVEELGALLSSLDSKILVMVETDKMLAEQSGKILSSQIYISDIFSELVPHVRAIVKGVDEKSKVQAQLLDGASTRFREEARRFTATSTELKTAIEGVRSGLNQVVGLQHATDTKLSELGKRTGVLASQSNALEQLRHEVGELKGTLESEFRDRPPYYFPSSVTSDKDGLVSRLRRFLGWG